MRIYIISYCQNPYQEQRVVDFVHSKRFQIVNPNFYRDFHNFPHTIKNREYYDLIKDREYYKNLIALTNNLMPRAEEVWNIQGSLGGANFPYEYENVLCSQLEVASELGKPVRFFKISHSGQSIGRAREVKRKEIFPVEFEEFMQNRLNIQGVLK